MIEMGKQYTTRDGRAVRILCTDLKGCGCATVIGLVTTPAGPEYVGTWTADGSVIPSERPISGKSCSDLIPVPTKHEGWVIVRDTPTLNGDGGYLEIVPGFLESRAMTEQRIQSRGLCPFEHPARVTWES